MAKQLFLNNFDTQFISPVKSAPTSGNPATELDYGILRVATGAAGALVNPSGGDWYILTGFKRSGSVETNVEIMKVTAVDTSVINEVRLTVLRGQEGTTPQSYVSGDYLSMRETAGALAAMVQTSDSRLSDSRTPSGAAGGVLSGTYPNPGFAVDMATQAELDAVAAAKEPTIAAATGTPTAQYWRGDKSWRDFATDVRAAVLTGLSTATNAAVSAADSVLVAIGKLQAQLANYLPKSNGSATGLTVDGLNGGQLAGFRNRIINGGFSVWQRGTSVTGTGVYTADQWYIDCVNAAYLAEVPGTVSLGSEEMVVTTSGTDTGYIQIAQFIPMRQSDVGQTFTFSFSIKNTGSLSAGRLQVKYRADNRFIRDGTVASDIAAMSAVPVGSYTRYTASFTIPAFTSYVGVGIYLSQINIATNAKELVRIKDVQFELGSVATPFEVRPYGTELALCQRYYWQSPTGTWLLNSGNQGSGSVTLTFNIQFPTTMRATPTTTISSSLTQANNVNYGPTSGKWGVLTNTVAWSTLSSGTLSFLIGSADSQSASLMIIGGTWSNAIATLQTNFTTPTLVASAEL